MYSTFWVRPRISADPRVQQQVVVARLFAECEIFVGLRRRENPLEIPAAMVLVDGFDEKTNVVGSEDVEDRTQFVLTKQ